MEITVSTILHRDLPAYLDSDAYRNARVLPISRHRAVSHAHNPRAQPDDLVLVLVYADGEMQGYLGVFPDLIYPAGQPERCGWLSCMWVNPAMRGKGIAKRLLQTVFDHWGKRILVTEFTPEAKGLYDSTQQFDELCQKEGLRGYVRPSLATILPPKRPIFARSQKLLGVLDALLSIPNALRLWALRPRSTAPFAYLAEMDAEAWAFVRERQTGEFMRRTLENFRWMARYPWLLSGGGADEDSRRYHFTSVVVDFRFFQIKIFNPKKEIVGYLMLALRDGHLRVPYAYFDAENARVVAEVLAWHCWKLPVTHISVFRPELVDLLGQAKNIFFARKKIRRGYIISKVFFRDDRSLDIQDGDADAAFT